MVENLRSVVVVPNYFLDKMYKPSVRHFENPTDLTGDGMVEGRTRFSFLTHLQRPLELFLCTFFTVSTPYSRHPSPSNVRVRNHTARYSVYLLCISPILRNTKDLFRQKIYCLRTVVLDHFTDTIT